MREIFSVGSESHRAVYMENISNTFDIFISLVYHISQLHIRTVILRLIYEAFDLILKRKAVVIEAMTLYRGHFSLIGNPTILEN
jgi:hypothetical protein